MQQHTRQIVILLISVVTLLTAGCGFHLRGMAPVPNEMKMIIVDSTDPYGPLTRAVHRELRDNGINVTSDKSQTDLLSLRLPNPVLSQRTVSIFQDGKTAEYQLHMVVTAQVLVPEKGLYPLNAYVLRSFFDNPLTALAKDEERDLIRNEMRKQIAQQIVRRLLTLEADIKNQSYQLAEQLRSPDTLISILEIENMNEMALENPEKFILSDIENIDFNQNTLSIISAE